MVAIGVLGPLAADVDGAPAELGGPRQRAVLALLLTARGATLSADRMIDELWRGSPPPRARASLQAYVSHLRRELEPGRSPRARGRLLVSTPPGYALRAPEEAVDAWRFERALARARALLADDPARARTSVAAALRLWRGEAYAEFADEAWAAAEAARLGGLRLTARETHAAATLRLGRPPEAVAEAEALTREEPLREEGWRLLVLALWADGRQADALAALRRVRRGLDEELGIGPGPELTALEDAILNRRWDALREALAARATPRTPPAPEAVHPAAAQPDPSGPAGEVAGSAPPSPRGPAPTAVHAAAPVRTTASRLEPPVAPPATPSPGAPPPHPNGPPTPGSPLAGTAGGVPASAPGVPERPAVPGVEPPVAPAASPAIAEPSPGGSRADPNGVPAPGSPLAGTADPGSAPASVRTTAAGEPAPYAGVVTTDGPARGAEPTPPVGGEAGAARPGSAVPVTERAPAGAPGEVAAPTAHVATPPSTGGLAPVDPAAPSSAALALPAEAPATGPEGDLPLGATPAAAGGLAPVDPAAEALFVGREDELGVVERVGGEVVGGGVRFVLVAGEAGAGKSSLLARAARRLRAGGWLTAVGRCPEAEGAPPAWAWEEIAGELARHAPPDPRWADDLAPLLDAGPPAQRRRRASDRFRLHRACRTWFSAATRARPLALFLDDLHRADRETLALLAGLAEDPPDGRLLVVAAYRPDEGDLAAVQAVLARRAPVRLPLDGLAPPDAVRLVRALAPVDAGTAAALAERTGGNPFFLLETARMLTAGTVGTTGTATPADVLHAVPDGVRDVLRRRFDRLPPAALSVLRLAAAAGREADVEVLVRAADAGEDTVLDGLDAGVAAGLLTEPGPGRIRFAHALVRDTLYADLTGLRRARLHAALGRALRELRPDDVSAIAHHHLQAPATATARTAVDYAVRAADLAGRRYAHDTAAELLEQAAACVERHPAAFAGEDAPARLVALLGLQLQARARGGAVAEAHGVRARAMDVAERHGRDDLLVQALTAWTEPTAWERRTYAHEDTRAAAALRRLLAGGGFDDVTRCRLLDALSSAVDSAAGPTHEARAAAAGAADLARGLGDPELLAQVLSTQSRVMDWEFDPGPREKVAAEMAQLAADHGMPAYAWFAENLAAGNAAVRGHVEAVRRHVARGLEIADAHRLSDPAAVGRVQAAALLLVEGRFADAERGYAEAVARLRANGSPHAEGMWALAYFALRWLEGRPAAALPVLEAAARQYGSLAGDSLALALVDAGRPEEARAVRANGRPSDATSITPSS